MTAARLNMRFPDGKVKALTLSYDDQSEQDIRLIDIMNESGISAVLPAVKALPYLLYTVY